MTTCSVTGGGGSPTGTKFYNFKTNNTILMISCAPLRCSSINCVPTCKFTNKDEILKICWEYGPDKIMCAKIWRSSSSTCPIVRAVGE